MNIFKSFTPEVVSILQRGGVGIIPCDTTYGIVASLFNQTAVERIYDIKGRESTQPVGTILISDPIQIEDSVDAADLLAAEVYWPGPTSVILELGSKYSYAHKGYKSLPFRIPDSKALQVLIDKTGPLATTSANMPGRRTATTLEELLGIFREAVDFYVDGGDLSHRAASKIIRLKANGEVETIRKGKA